MSLKEKLQQIVIHSDTTAGRRFDIFIQSLIAKEIKNGKV